MVERARWQAAGVVVLVFALGALAVGWNPANLPAPLIERWILHKLPLGSSIVAVRNAIDEEGWEAVDEMVSDDGSIVIVEIGRRMFPRNYIYMQFGFDRFGRLISTEMMKRAAPWEPQRPST